MKGIRTILVLLVVVVFVAPTAGTRDAFAGDIPENSLEDNPQYKSDFYGAAGASDDGSDGDPGEAGDGYGVQDTSDPFGTAGVGIPDTDLDDALRMLLMQFVLLL
ncbi:hypothetical protein DRQ50_07640 [bacterium]|nr:MAG: hypothetical protein DRQ50_07640 [bacterium]